MPLQQTIEKAASLTGVGLHTGFQTKVTLVPAPEGYGIRFVRTDLDNQPELPADIDFVGDLSRGTALCKDGVTLHSTEHVMAALCGMEIDNCRIEVAGPEVPILDGSAQPFVDLIVKAGIKEQSAQREYLVIEEPIMFVKNDIALGAFPLDHFCLTLEVDYKHPALGAQYTTMLKIKDFAKDFSEARTFCFLSEVEKLREANLIRGGSLDSAVVVQDVETTPEHLEYLRKLFPEQGDALAFGENGFLNNSKLRYYNELCRHKAVDLIGDLYMLGKPIRGHIVATRTGHAANIEMAHKIREHFVKKAKGKKGEKQESAISYQDILDMLPHRYPFLLIDKVLKVEPNKSCVAVKNVSFNDPFFMGHFPGNPVMPGVLQVEAMAQAGGIMCLAGRKDIKEKTILFMGIDKTRFRDVVRPGDALRIEVEVLQLRRNTVRFAGKCFVDQKLVCEAELFAMIDIKEGTPA